MNEQDRQAIEELFARLAQAEQQAGPRDAEADAFIKRRIEEQPGAPYMMAQTIVMQTYALEQAQQRIEELERKLADAEDEEDEAPAGSGLFGGLFGGGNQTERSRRGGVVPAAGQPMGAPRGMAPPQAEAGGGGFLSGAAQTAMGVAGGILMGNALGSMFGGGSSTAQAAPDTSAITAPTEPPAAEPTPPPAEPAPEPAAEDGGGGFFESLFGGGDDSDF